MPGTSKAIPDQEEIGKVCQDSKSDSDQKHLRNDKWPMKQPGKNK